MCVAAHGPFAPGPSSVSQRTCPERWRCSRARRPFFDTLEALGEDGFAQDMAEVLEAVLWERAKSIRNGCHWATVAEEMVETMDSTWPPALCTSEQAASIAVTLTATALRDRFKGLWKDNRSVGALRRPCPTLMTIGSNW